MLAAGCHWHWRWCSISKVFGSRHYIHYARKRSTITLDHLVLVPAMQCNATQCGAVWWQFQRFVSSVMAMTAANECLTMYSILAICGVRRGMRSNVLHLAVKTMLVASRHRHHCLECDRVADRMPAPHRTLKPAAGTAGTGTAGTTTGITVE
jgi:hypothetical protein